MSNAQTITRMAMRYGLNTVLIMETISTVYMYPWRANGDSAQAREASKTLSPRGVWQELILSGVGSFLLAGRFACSPTANKMNSMICQSFWMGYADDERMWWCFHLPRSRLFVCSVVRRVLALVFSSRAPMDCGFGHDLQSNVSLLRILYHLSRTAITF